MIKLYICCLVLIIGSVEVGPDTDMKFHQEVMEIVSYDTTVDRTRGRATNQSAPVERMWYRIILECRLLQITTTHLENPQEWKESVQDVESQSTSQARNVQPRMQSARSATKLDISVRYANPRKKTGEPILPREYLKQNRTLTSMKMQSDNPIHLW